MSTSPQVYTQSLGENPPELRFVNQKTKSTVSFKLSVAYNGRLLLFDDRGKKGVMESIAFSDSGDAFLLWRNPRNVDAFAGKVEATSIPPFTRWQSWLRAKRVPFSLGKSTVTQPRNSNSKQQQTGAVLQKTDMFWTKLSVPTPPTFLKKLKFSGRGPDLARSADRHERS